MSNEPEYIQRMRRVREEREKKSAASAPPRADGADLNVQEREALRWAREIGGTDLRSVKNLSGSKYAVVFRVSSASGTKFVSIEGLPNREALVERVRPGGSMGEEVIGAYEVKGGRPVTITVEDSELKLVMGSPRPGANPLSPAQMLRKAAAEAATMAKTRTSDRERGGGGGGRR